MGSEASSPKRGKNCGFLTAPAVYVGRLLKMEILGRKASGIGGGLRDMPCLKRLPRKLKMKRSLEPMHYFSLPPSTLLPKSEYI